jgi:hypothetical protein
MERVVYANDKPTRYEGKGFLTWIHRDITGEMWFGSSFLQPERYIEEIVFSFILK